VVGHAATISAGEWITASGEWVNDRTHGQQFKARFLRTSPPTSADGIEKYLSSHFGEIINSGAAPPGLRARRSLARLALSAIVRPRAGGV
jgi:exodeoxyribonuclease V alpha subunit